MEHWQQVFLRSDPWSSIPFAHEVRTEADVIVGLVCLAAVALVALFGG